jgi:signal peptidase I
MSPTLRIGERLVYDKRVDWDRVKPGSIILYKNADDSAWGKPGVLVTARVLAGPGDRLSIENDNYLVNGNRGPKIVDARGHVTVMDVPSSPKATTVPEDCYYIVQDSGYDSRVLSWVRKNRIVGSRLWYLSGRGIFRIIE